MPLYADVIIDISTEKLDRPFSYRVPEELKESVHEGAEVKVPFGAGNRERKGYVVGFSEKPAVDESKIKDILSVDESSVSAEAKLLSLASWMHRRYGSTMINSLQTVLPVKKKIKEKSFKNYCRNKGEAEIRAEIASLNPVRFAGRIRMLNALLIADVIPGDIAVSKFSLSPSVAQTLEKQGFIKVETTRQYRNPVAADFSLSSLRSINLTDEQKLVVKGIKEELGKTDRRTCLIQGVTGSGKTEVYMELIRDVVSKGKQAIVLIPEIALTFQTLMRFYAVFGDRVSVIHSKLSPGERYDQYERALNGNIDIMIGPRSALFTPFKNTGLIVIDEEHETSYKSEKMPKYHAREVAEYIAAREGAGLVMGSATPSVESSYKARQGIYAYFKLENRFGNAVLPTVHIVDMRKELKSGNKSFLSRELSNAISERLIKGEQTMLFINRRGVAGFISCRSCGYVMKCPHCDVSMTEHADGRVVCHYCGHTIRKPEICPECGSRYISGFKAGTEAVEAGLKKMYPSARVIRMDADTTKEKDGHEKLLSLFADGKADIMVGTQMIVKGHDFPNVTLVGAIAADISLFSSDYHSPERTFDLLTQAAGRAGRGDRAGEVFIQTYDPEHYALKAAADQDYERFYKEEIIYRKLGDYPPLMHVLLLEFYSKDKQAGELRAGLMAERAKGREGIAVLGPAPAAISRIRDIYRTGLYFKSADIDKLTEIKDQAEALQAQFMEAHSGPDVTLQFDFDPVENF